MSTSALHRIDFDKWTTLSDDTTVLSRNAPYIPHPVSKDEIPFPRADGSWGPHEISLLPQFFDPEHPYLAYIIIKEHHRFRLPQSIVTHRFKNSDFYRYPQLPTRGQIKSTVTTSWFQEVDSYRHHILRLYEDLQTVFPGPYKCPSIALARAEDTLFTITHNILSYRDAVEFTRGLQRFVAEIHAFIVWGYNILGRTVKDSEPLHSCFRGSYVSSSADFNYLSAAGAPVFYLTGECPSDLPADRYIRITELDTLCESRTWTDVHVVACNRDIIKGKLVHSKPLMFYPPHVDQSDPLAFERAARGYGPRQDKQRFDQRMVTDSLSVRGREPQPSLPQNKRKPQDSDWRRQTKSLRNNWPSWGCDWDYIWHFHAQGDGLPEYTTPDSPIPSHGANFMYAVPPVHLLSNLQSDEKRAKVFFTWISIRRIWLLRYQDHRLNNTSHDVATKNNNSPPSPMHLHTQTWRDILSGQWWMKKWAPSSYDHRFFWRHGGSLVLGPSKEDLEQEKDDPTRALYSVSDDLSPLLAPERRLQLKDFENKALCNLVVYDLALLNHKLQFEETDDHVMRMDAMPIRVRRARLQARQDLFRSSWDIPKDAFPWHDIQWESSQNWRQAIPWYTRFRDLLADWPRRFDLGNIDWHKDLSVLCQWRFTDYCRGLVVFYRHAVMNVLGIAVAPLLRYPCLDSVDPFFLSM